MAITHPQAADFADTKCRQLADLIERMDRAAQQFLTIVDRDFTTLPPVVAAGDSDVIDSQIPRDPRPAVTKGDVASLKSAAELITGFMAAQNRRAIIKRWSVNSTPPF